MVVVQTFLVRIITMLDRDQLIQSKPRLVHLSFQHKQQKYEDRKQKLDLTIQTQFFLFTFLLIC